MKIDNNITKSNSFNGASPYVLDKGAKIADIFIKSQENLSSTRFIQDTATNWAPKAIFSRSKEDFCEMTFLEFLESGIFYFASPILGEKLFRQGVYKNLQPKNLKETVNSQIPRSVAEITKDGALSQAVKTRSISSKAGILLSCAIIPVTEYTLSFAKNYFTLKTFKKSNFNNIANLDKNKNEKEDKNQQERVEKNAKKQFKKAAIISSLGVISGLMLALFGHKSEKLQTLSKTILEPGKAIAGVLDKAGVKNEKVKNTISSFSLDFANNNGKLALSKGQLALTAILGLFGYSKAAEDRGKLDVQEVWTRVPLVVFYTIFGSELFEKGFINILDKKQKCPDLIKKGADGKIFTPSSKELPELAKKVAKEKLTSPDVEYKKLLKQKAIVSAVPYAFSLLFMGFSLSAITRLWTQYRYNKEKKSKSINQIKTDYYYFLGKNLPEQYKAFKKN